MLHLVINVVLIVLFFISLLIVPNEPFISSINDRDLLPCFSNESINTMDYSHSIKIKSNEAVCYLTPTIYIKSFPNISWNGYYINNLCVHPKHRRKGNASKLIKDVIFRAKLENKDHLIMYVSKSNIPAINLYQKYGFHMYQETPKYLIMVKYL
jgi:predicted acetyltransferase